jgi:hypothetical protein
MSSDAERLGRRLATVEEQVNQINRQGVGLGQSSFEEGSINQYVGSTIGSSFGTQFDGSNGLYVLNGPEPPTPLILAEDVTQVPGGLKIRWGGEFVSLEPTPMGFTQVEVHVSTDPAFSGLLYPSLRTFLTSPRGGEAVVMLGSPGPYYVRLVTRTNAGRASVPSGALGPFTPGTLGRSQLAPDIQSTLTSADGLHNVTFAITNPPTGNPGGKVGDIWFRRGTGVDANKIIASWEWTGTTWASRLFGDAVLSSLTVSKLVSGVFQAGVTATIGNPTGARIDISGTAIEQVDATGQITFQLTPGGGALFRGVLTGQSTNFVEGTQGWRLEEDGDAFLQNVQVAENLSAQSASFTDLTISGVPLGDIIDSRPRGLIAQGFNTTVNLQGLTAETGIVEQGFTAYPGRGYLIVVDGPTVASSTTDTVPYVAMKGTTDGSAPTVGSTFVAHMGEFPPGGPTPGSSPANYPFRPVKGSFLWYPPGITNPAGQQARLLMVIGRAAGSVSGSVGANCTQYRCQMSVYDQGPALPNSMQVNNSTVVAPPPPPPPPIQSYEQTIFSAWTASYRQNGVRWSDNDRMYQGYGDSLNGNQASLIGFDYGYLRSVLAGSVIRSAILYIRNQHTWNSGGATAWVGSHAATGMPATYTSGGFERRSATNTAQGGWIGVDVLGVFNEIRDGASTGLMLGRAPDNGAQHYGYWFGQNYDDRPRVVFRFEK